MHIEQVLYLYFLGDSFVVKSFFGIQFIVDIQFPVKIVRSACLIVFDGNIAFGCYLFCRTFDDGGYDNFTVYKPEGDGSLRSIRPCGLEEFDKFGMYPR